MLRQLQASLFIFRWKMWSLLKIFQSGRTLYRGMMYWFGSQSGSRLVITGTSQNDFVFTNFLLSICTTEFWRRGIIRHIRGLGLEAFLSKIGEVWGFKYAILHKLQYQSGKDFLQVTSRISNKFLKFTECNTWTIILINWMTAVVSALSGIVCVRVITFID